MIRPAAALALACIAAGCALPLPPPIDYSYRAKSQDSRAQFLILHYTWGDHEGSLKVLTEGPVSSHYRVRDHPVEVYALVDESRRAFHAGVSSWKGQTALNASSIGIEIVNAGDRLAPQGIAWQPYPPAQVDAVVDLVKWIVKRHGIRPDRILGHAEIAPHRKSDPGPLFPWKRLADEGLVTWPDERRVAERKSAHAAALPDVAWFQRKLKAHGFEVAAHGRLDAETRRVLAVFQMRYRPADFSGTPDAETAAILEVLTSPPAGAAAVPQPAIIPVRDWGGTPADATRARRHAISHITIHHQGETYPPARDPAEYLRALQSWSRRDKKWIDIPYHYVIDMKGRIHEGRDIAFAGDTNTEYDPAGHALIEIVGNMEEVEPNAEQLDALVRLSTWLAAEHGVAPERILGHRDHSSATVCPGKNLYRYLENGYIRERVRAGLAQAAR